MQAVPERIQRGLIALFANRDSAFGAEVANALKREVRYDRGANQGRGAELKITRCHWHRVPRR
jgi:hypothetical protein